MGSSQKTITIIGAGSAGLFTAVILSNKIKDLTINIIRDPKKGVIGVGESTVGSFSEVLRNHCGINQELFDFFVKPVSKHGIWFDFGNKEFHYTFDYCFDNQFFSKDLPDGFNFKGGNYGHSEFSRMMINRNPIIPNERTVAYHLRNDLLLAYLEKLSRERGVNFIDDNIKTVERKGDNIVSLNKKYKADLFIDCSGFNSILNKSKWYSYDDYLVNDKAIFFRRELSDIRPYTKATTMPNGWLWEIDHRDISGCGYVYSSKYVSDEQALKELEKKVGKVENYRIIPFKTGRLEKHWIGNYVTIGNADAFVEPLESTAIMGFLTMARHVADIFRYGDNKGDLIDRYNKFCNEYYDNIRDFIFAHFCFNRKSNTKYWKDYRKRASKFPEGQGKEILRYYLINNTHIKFQTQFYTESNPFNLEGWYSIFRGLEVEKQNTSYG